MTRLIIFLGLYLAIQSAGYAQGSGFESIEYSNVVVCPASSAAGPPPSFEAANCAMIIANAVDPQDKAIWIKTLVNLDQTTGPKGEPLAVLISGKFSSDVYLNGQFIGSNGSPHLDPERESSGFMDAVIYAPQTLFQAGENTIVLKASSHGGLLNLAHPVHWIGIGPAKDPQHTIMAHYWPSLPTLGLFVLTMIYFLTTAVSGRQRQTSLSLFSMCAFAALQLSAELSRGMIAYTYPTHDIRLMLIVIFSSAFGVSFSSLVSSLFAPHKTTLVIFASAILSLVGIIAVEGYDQKAAAAMLAPIALSVILLSYWSFKKAYRARRYLVIGLIFVTTNLAFLSYFLDVLFFYLVALLMIFLLAESAFNAAEQVRRRREAEGRANRLELALEQVVQAEKPVEIAVKSNGRIDRITADRIIQLRSSGGYVEILTDDGRELLHNESLSEVEKRLSLTFIRVHRSHLVNTRHVQSLKRSDQGNGWLVLSDASEVPVSRRIMPSVRRALG
ncbi:LytTR family DNA-binding domain-containing protein [Parasphingorhabdus litoris]|nr:LytTR family DNA-binding domain-containing protein [Parasphingorhabdus litoris]